MIHDQVMPNEMMPDSKTPDPKTVDPMRRFMKTDLVLLHGWGMQSSLWEGLPETLEQRIESHALNLPGHGGADFDPGWWSLSHWADQCLQQAPEQAIWWGWSLGGLVAMQAALQAPKRVRALILMGSTPRFTQAADWRCAMPEATLDGFAEGLSADVRGTLERFLGLQVRGSEAGRETLRTLRARLEGAPDPEPSALKQGLELLREEDLRGPLPDLSLPTLWLFGERDTLVPVEVAERVALLQPEARVEIIPGAAHAPQLSHPDAVADAVARFLDR